MLFRLFLPILATSVLSHASTVPTSPPDAAIQQALNVSTGNPSKCANGTKYFLQPVDHATYDGKAGGNSTFLQQFQVVDEYFKPGGPIIYYQGTENAKMLCAEQTAGMSWAKDMGALLVLLEHRYFGISCPYGLNYTEQTTWPVSSLKPLTLDNVLLDAVTFVNWVKQYYAKGKDNKVIFVSGSYGGTLAAVARVKHPETFYGSIASSFLTTGLISDPKAPNIFAWGDWANQVYNDVSFAASQKIRSAMSALRAQVSSGNFGNLQKALNLCTAPTSPKDGQLLAYKLMETYIENLQQDLSAFGKPFEKLINATLSLPSDAPYTSVLNLSVEASTSYDPAPCLDWEPDFAAGGPYQYLQCIYLPQLNGYTANSSIWGLNSPDLFLNSSDKYLLDPWCKAAFNISSVQGGAAYQASIGLDAATLKNTSRLLLTAGLKDPVTGTGTPPWYDGQHTMQQSRVYLVQGGAHTADIIVEYPADSEGVKEARATYLHVMKAWLASADV